MTLFRAPLAAFALAAAVPAWPQAERLPGSPYPASSNPDTLYQVDLTGDDGFTAMSLQGVLAKTKPRLYLGNDRWLGELRQTPGITVSTAYRNNLQALLTRFRPEITGMVLCARGTASTNAALSLCGPLRAIAVTSQNRALAEGLGIPLLQDARNLTEAAVLQTHGARFATAAVTLLEPAKDSYLVDYTAFTDSFRFWAAPGTALFDAAFARLRPHAMGWGWGPDEFATIQAASRRSAQFHPSDYCRNLSTLSNVPAPAGGLVQRARDPGTLPARQVHTVAFVMTDGDNLQWQLGNFSTHASWFGSPNRGRVNLGWTTSPALAELAPAALAYFYRMASAAPGAGDQFIGGPSGLGYFFPDRYPGLDSAASVLAGFLRKADLRIVNLIADQNPSDAAFAAYLRHGGVEAVFHYPFQNHYVRTNGRTEVRWILGKPVITAGHSFWEGRETAASLAAKLNALPRDPRRPESYSLVPVHVWSKNVDSVIACVRRLDSNGVEVVLPETLARRLAALNPSALRPRAVPAYGGPRPVSARFPLIRDGQGQPAAAADGRRPK